MNLYHLQYDDQPYYVQAETVAWAVQSWKEHVKKLWGSEYEGTEEPQSVALIHDEEVIIQSNVHASSSK